MIMAVNETRLSNPRCHVFLLNDDGQPRNDYDRRYKTLLLTFRVRLCRHSSTAVVFLRRKFSEPLAVVTIDRHYLTARSKVSRMLDVVRVPHRRNGSDIVRRIVAGIRRVASDPEVNALPVLRVQVNVDAAVLRLPPPSSWSERDRFENGPPILVDGFFSRNYEDYYVATPITITRRDIDSDFEPIFVPASREAIQSLEKVVMASNGDDVATECSVCLEVMAVGTEATRLACSHCFHGVCVVKWLEQSNYCPLCRFQLPT